MTASRLDLGGFSVGYDSHGPEDGPPVVLLHGLGLDLTMWDAVMPLLPPGPRYVRFDLRGHGISDVPPPPYTMGTLIRDAERGIEALGLRDAVVIGLSLGGMIAQGLAVKRLDLVRALVLSNTAVKIATPEIWAKRIEAVEKGGLSASMDASMERWFPRALRDSPAAQALRNSVLSQPVDGWIGCASAIAGTDFYTTTATLTLPTLLIAGSEDGSIPADLVRETAALIKGSRFHLIRGTGHLPPIDHPAEWVAIVDSFLAGIGHS